MEYFGCTVGPVDFRCHNLIEICSRYPPMAVLKWREAACRHGNVKFCSETYHLLMRNGRYVRFVMVLDAQIPTGSGDSCDGTDPGELSLVPSRFLDEQSRNAGQEVKIYRSISKPQRMVSCVYVDTVVSYRISTAAPAAVPHQEIIQACLLPTRRCYEGCHNTGISQPKQPNLTQKRHLR